MRLYRVRRLCLAAVAAALSACSPLAPPSVGELSQEAPEGATAVLTQTLYRVRYSGPAGNGSLRLVMRQAAPDRFQLRAADSFGRAVWSLDLDGDRVLLVNHRRREACLSGAELRVPEVALQPLPLPAVARVLASHTPLPAPIGADPADWVDSAGQRWTARWEADRLSSWTLWQAGEPQLWWGRHGTEGVLSHRDGSQFRWRQTAVEKLQRAAYEPLEAPPEYSLGACPMAADGL